MSSHGRELVAARSSTGAILGRTREGKLKFGISNGADVETAIPRAMRAHAVFTLLRSARNVPYRITRARAMCKSVGRNF
jgi:hypothetical protein